LGFLTEISPNAITHYYPHHRYLCHDHIRPFNVLLFMPQRQWQNGSNKQVQLLSWPRLHRNAKE